MKKDRIFPIRLSQQDSELIAAIQKKTGTESEAAVCRQGIRVYAEKLDIPLPSPKPSRSAKP